MYICVKVCKREIVDVFMSKVDGATIAFSHKCRFENGPHVGVSGSVSRQGYEAFLFGDPANYKAAIYKDGLHTRFSTQGHIQHKLYSDISILFNVQV